MAMILASYPMWCFMSYHYLMSRFAMKSNFTNVKLLCFIMLAKMCPHRLKMHQKVYGGWASLDPLGELTALTQSFLQLLMTCSTNVYLALFPDINHFFTAHDCR